MTLNTSRALIIDDEYDQVQPLIIALGSLKIGSIYLNGEIEQLDSIENGLGGIRLAFVDIDLAYPPDMDGEEKVSSTVRYLSKAIGPNPGMIALFLWTNKPETEEIFRGQLKTHCPKLIPVHLECISKDRGLSADKIELKVRESLEKFKSFRIFWDWERLVHQAATATTVDLINVLREDSKLSELSAFEEEHRDKFDIAGMDVLASLAIAAQQEPTDQDRSTSSNALMQALVPVLADKIEHGESLVEQFPVAGKELGAAVKRELTTRKEYKKTAEQAEQYKSATSALKLDAFSGADFIRDPDVTIEEAWTKEIRKKKVIDLLEKVSPGEASNLSVEQIARLNRAISLSQVPRHPEPFSLLPGNIYKWEEMRRETKGKDDAYDVTEALMQQFSFSARKGPYASVLVEVSPVCDVAQGKVGHSGLIWGLLAPAKHAAKIPKRALNLRSYGPFYITQGEFELDKGSYILALNARYNVSVVNQVLREIRPQLRLRNAVVADIQAWLSAYSSRPGIIQVGS